MRFAESIVAYSKQEMSRELECGFRYSAAWHIVHFWESREPRKQSDLIVWTYHDVSTHPVILGIGLLQLFHCRGQRLLPTRGQKWLIYSFHIPFHILFH